MNHKEKAAELIEKFRPFAHKNFNHVNDGETEKAKQCAIIAVDEIIESIPLSPNYVDWDDCGATHQYWYEAQKEEALNFWQEVKKELTI